jgi:hypothetical protein
VTAEHELNEPLVLRDVIMPGLKMLDKNGREESLLRRVVENSS